MSHRTVAVLGGTFDPIHVGHVSVLEQVVAALPADEGWLLPARRHVLREGDAGAGERERLALARAAAQGHPGLRVDITELHLPVPTRTLVTQRRLAQLHPGTEFWWVLGADRVRSIGDWYGAAELLAQARFVCVNRHGIDEVTASELAALGFRRDAVRVLRVESPAISASEIRDRLARGGEVRGLVSDPVLDVIRRRGLYGTSATLAP